jgi:hypothetical protein
MVTVNQSYLSDWEKLEGEFSNALFIVVYIIHNSW